MSSRHQLPAADLADLLGRLATALGAGIDVRRAWAGEVARAPKRWRPAFAAVSAELDGGASLAESLAAAGRAFPPLVRGMVAVGDETGHEPEILRQLAGGVRDGLRARRALRQSLAQPSFQLAVALVVIGILILVAGLLRDAAGRPIDLVGSGLAGPSGLAWYLAGIAAVGGAVVAGWRLARAEWQAGGTITRRLTGLVPVVGPAVRAAEAAAWCRVAGLAAGAGLPAGRLMRLTALVAPGLACNPDETEDALRAGASLADVLRAAGRFPRRLVEAVEVGELTGDTAEVLGRLAADFEDEARRGIAAAVRVVGFCAWALVAGLIALVVFRIFSSYLGMIHDAAGRI